MDGWVFTCTNGCTLGIAAAPPSGGVEEQPPPPPQHAQHSHWGAVQAVGALLPPGASSDTGVEVDLTLSAPQGGSFGIQVNEALEVRVRVKRIGHLETMHDSYLPTV